MRNPTKSTWSARRRDQKGSDKQKGRASSNIRTKSLNTNAKRKTVDKANIVEQEEINDEDARLVPSCAQYVLSFETPSLESFQKIITNASNYAYEVKTGQRKKRDRGAPADEKGFLSDFVQKVRVQYRAYTKYDIRIKMRTVFRRI